METPVATPSGSAVRVEVGVSHPLGALLYPHCLLSLRTLAQRRNE
jgi:hypothetical protein